MPKKIESVFISEMEQRFGDEIGHILVSDETEQALEVISTGSLSLDVSIGVGGIPKGKLSIIFGPEASGKSSLALSISKQAIKGGDRVLYIDVENQIDYDYARALVGEGFESGNFTIVQPDTAEDAFDVAEIGINSGEFGLIVFDSIGALAPDKEKKDDFADANVGLVPRLLSKFLRRNSYPIRRKQIAFLFINQVRDTIGSYMQSYSMPGGHALKHYSSLIISLTKGQEIKQKDTAIGINTKFIVRKNKLAPPFRSFIVPLIFGIGIDSSRDLVQFAEMLGVLKRSGPYYKFEEITLGSGLTKASEYLVQNKPVLDKVVEMCYNVSGNKSTTVVIEDEVELSETAEETTQKGD